VLSHKIKSVGLEFRVSDFAARAVLLLALPTFLVPDLVDCDLLSHDPLQVRPRVLLCSVGATL